MPQLKKIKIRRGLNVAKPAGGTEAGELRYSTDTKELFIDDGSANVKVGKDIDALSTDLKARANHTGTQSADTVIDGTTNKAYTATEKTKLSGIATGATANTINNTLTSTSTTDALSAAQGKALKDTADTLSTTVGTKAPLASPAFTGTPTGITKTHVGLANVDNTSDVNKIVSTVQQTALDGKSATSHAHSGTYEPANANIQSHVTAAHAPANAEANTAKKSTIHHSAPTSLAITETLHNNVEIHLEGTGNLTINATAVTTDTFGFSVINTDAGATRTLTPTGFAGVFKRSGGTNADLGNVAFDIADNTKYQFTVTLNGASRYLNVEDLNDIQLKTINGDSIVGEGNLVISADLPGGNLMTVTDEGLVYGNSTPDRVTVPGQTILKYLTTGATTFTPPIGVTSVRVLTVAGGGGGGVGIGGGGGAGGVVASPSVAVSGSISITVGVGGAGRTGDGAGTAGSNSTFGAITATGGGQGGGWTAGAGIGGSGGGGNSGNVTMAPGGAGMTDQGFAGGTGLTTTINGSVGAGGGGAGAIGGNGGTVQADGVGGVGASNDITGTATFYGGGGGGGLYVLGATTTPRPGGSGGGGAGNGISTASVAGTANTGGGGGGNQGSSSAAGGSGIVIIRFATQSRSYQALQSFASNALATAGGLLKGQFFINTTTGGIAQVP